MSAGEGVAQQKDHRSNSPQLLHNSNMGPKHPTSHHVAQVPIFKFVLFYLHTISNNLRQSRCPYQADEYHTCPRGKHGCATRFHFRESASKCPAKVHGIQVAVPHNTLTLETPQCPAKKNLVLTKCTAPPPTPWGRTQGCKGITNKTRAVEIFGAQHPLWGENCLLKN